MTGYLMKLRGWTLQESYTWVRDRHKPCNVGSGVQSHLTTGTAQGLRHSPTIFTPRDDAVTDCAGDAHRVQLLELKLRGTSSTGFQSQQQEAGTSFIYSAALGLYRHTDKQSQLTWWLYRLFDRDLKWGVMCRIGRDSCQQRALRLGMEGHEPCSGSSERGVPACCTAWSTSLLRPAAATPWKLRVWLTQSAAAATTAVWASSDGCVGRAYVHYHSLLPVAGSVESGD